MMPNRTMYITLSIDETFSISTHLQELTNQKIIRSFCLNYQNKKCLTKIGVTLADGKSYSATLIANGRRTDITTLQFENHKTLSADHFASFVAALNPLWAGLNVDVDTTLRPLCSSLAHLSLLPRFSQFSYWNNRYNILFSDKLSELPHLDFCQVQKINNGYWIEIKHKNTEDFENKRAIIENILAEQGLWDFDVNPSDAVFRSLHNQISLRNALLFMKNWRDSHAQDAVNNIDNIIEIATRAIKDRGNKRRAKEICFIKSDIEGNITSIWMECFIQTAVEWAKREINSSLISWAIILYNFENRPKKSKKINNKMFVFNSYAREVGAL